MSARHGRSPWLRTICGLGLWASLTLTPAVGSADGLALAPSHLAPAERAQLRQAIDAFRATNPQAFAAVAAVEGHRPEVYRQFRNPVPLVGRELRRLGPQALLPMLEALAFDAPARGTATDREWDALRVGMLEAVGVLRDARSAPVLHGIFAGSHSPNVMATVAQGIGRLCTPAGGGASSRDLLIAATGDASRRAAAIAGLGQCRDLVAANQLTTMLDATADAAEAERIADALGVLGSSWAWTALGPAVEARGEAVRAHIAAALVRSFSRRAAPAQRAYLRGLSMVDHPRLGALVQAERTRLEPAARMQLESLAARLDKRRR